MEWVAPGSSGFSEGDWIYQHYLQTLDIYPHGSWLDIFVCRMTNAGLGLLFSIFYMPLSLAMMFLGAWAVKSGLHTRTDSEVWLKKVCRITLPTGLFLNFLILISEVGWITNMTYQCLVTTPAMCLGFPVLSIGYMSAVYLLVRKKGHWKGFNWIADAGRMPLTNYLLQSIAGTWIFYSYGGGLYGSVGYAFPLLLALAIYGGQLVFSRFWMSRFEYGPMEWLWRRATYLR